jgi:hypothetical protein
MVDVLFQEPSSLMCFLNILVLSQQQQLCVSEFLSVSTPPHRTAAPHKNFNLKCELPSEGPDWFISSEISEGTRDSVNFWPSACCSRLYTTRITGIYMVIIMD